MSTGGGSVDGGHALKDAFLTPAVRNASFNTVAGRTGQSSTASASISTSRPSGRPTYTVVLAGKDSSKNSR